MITVYLFCGGVGAGALFVACAIDLAWMREAIGSTAAGFAVASIESADPCRRVQARLFLTGTVLVIFGVFCLLFDLGRLDRAATLFVYPSATYLSMGSFALLALVVLGILLSVSRFAQVEHVSRRLVSIFEALTLAVAFFVMLYTGLLLSSMHTIALWDTWLVPVLFVLSSLSGGCGAALAISGLTEGESLPLRYDMRIVHVDTILIVLEICAAIAFVWLTLMSTRPSAVASANILLLDFKGDLGLVWWLGFCGLGLVAPLILDLVAARRWRIAVRLSAASATTMYGASSRPLPELFRRALTAGAVCVLIGAFCLRFALVNAGQHRELLGPDALTLVTVVQTIDEQELE